MQEGQLMGRRQTITLLIKAEVIRIYGNER